MTLSGCRSGDPPCVRVDAGEFMRPHTFKGVATDRFIGVSTPVHPERNPGDSRAYKEVYDATLFHTWRILWIPTRELPADYLERVKRQPNAVKPLTINAAQPRPPEPPVGAN